MAEQPLFPGLEQGLMDAQQHQRHLAAAVESRKLWMEAGVAEDAAQCCLQAADNLEAWLADANVLADRLPFGDNHDGNLTAEAYGVAGTRYLEVMKGVGELFLDMAATYQAAGGLMEQTDQHGAQGLDRGMR
ncbi:MAG: hypothetical protein H0U62_09180 [Actinobacteria bacterium]|nr:hypothetical protein [Actinomycetota bacterium]